MWRFEEFRKTRRDATRRTCKVVWIIYALQPEAYIGKRTAARRLDRWSIDNAADPKIIVIHGNKGIESLYGPNLQEH
jgi:hypothetical protein